MLPMHSRKKLQKEETSALIPKKSLREELLEEAHWLKAPTLARPFSDHLHEWLYDRRSW